MYYGRNKLCGSVYLEYSKLDTFIRHTLQYSIIPSSPALASNVNGKNKHRGGVHFYPSTFTTTPVFNLNLTTPLPRYVVTTPPRPVLSRFRRLGARRRQTRIKPRLRSLVSSTLINERLLLAHCSAAYIVLFISPSLSSEIQL